MTRSAQPHHAAQVGQKRTTKIKWNSMMTLETKPAAVFTQTARRRLARRSERLPFPAAIDGCPELPGHLRSQVRG